MSDRDLIEALINRNPETTRWFFYRKCRPLFYAIIRRVFDKPVEYDEFVNELYTLLMENDAYRLRQFDFRSSPYQWIKTVALRHFIRKRDDLTDNQPPETPYDKEDLEKADNCEVRQDSRIDLDLLIARMHNPRAAHVIQRIVIDDAEPRIVAEELNVTVENLYNIKKRAIALLTRIALADTKIYHNEANI